MSNTTFSKCTIINMGQSPDSESYNEIGEGLPFYQGNADFGELYPVRRCYCSKPNKTAEKNDILLSVRAPIGAVNIANEKCCIGRGLCAISQIENVSFYKYLYYFLLSKNRELNEKGIGSTFKAICKNNLTEMQVELPTIEEQKKIAEILNKASNLISLRKKQIEKLNLLVKAKFIDMFGDPIRIIEHGQTLMIEEITDEVSVGFVGESVNEYVEEGIPYLRMQNIRPMNIDSQNLIYINEDFHKRIPKANVFTGDIVISRVGVNRGMTAVIPNKFNNSSIGNAVIIRSNRKFNSTFIASYVNFAFGNHTSIGYSKGSAQGAISVGLVKKWFVPNVSIDLQNAFADFVQQVEKQKIQLQQGLEKLELTYKALMQQYFN